ncbi:DUF2633 family protein [Erwinia pyrifoliae]|nr:DUF2633 family protein [Erwinia pyrifoliae]
MHYCRTDILQEILPQQRCVIRNTSQPPRLIRVIMLVRVIILLGQLISVVPQAVRHHQQKYSHR